MLLKAIAEAPLRPARGHRRLGLRLLRLGQKLVRQEPRLRPRRTARSCGHPLRRPVQAQIDDPRIGDLLDLDQRQDPAPRSSSSTCRQGAGHPEGHGADRRVDVHGPAAGTRLRRGLRHRRAGDRAGGRGQARRVHRATVIDACGRRPTGSSGGRSARARRSSSRASAVLHEIDPHTYPRPTRGRHALRGTGTPTITVSKVVERTFELVGRRRPGKALVFIIDEVGQHVARSGDKIEDLRAVVEEFGKVGKNLLSARTVLAPSWIVVTSQEKLDEVVSAIGDSGVVDRQAPGPLPLPGRPRPVRHPRGRHQARARQEGRRPSRRCRSSSRDREGQLNAACRLERTTRKTEVSERRFRPVLSRTRRTTSTCASASCRASGSSPAHPASITAAATGRSSSKPTRCSCPTGRHLRQKPIGTLVTLDKVFELVEGNLSNEKRTDIHDIAPGSRTTPRTTAGPRGSPRRSACWSSSATCPAPRPTSPPVLVD